MASKSSWARATLERTMNMFSKGLIIVSHLGCGGGGGVKDKVDKVVSQ